jgi:Asp-tRNA(Asn)/Glu-tRNA(Gln) amidotransferase A subunit family amidase
VIKDNSKTIAHVIIAVILVRILLSLLTAIYYKCKNWRIMKAARKLLEARDGKSFDFQVSNVNVQKIQSSTMTQLKEGLVKGEITSVDLVNVFGMRC